MNFKSPPPLILTITKIHQYSVIKGTLIYLLKSCISREGMKSHVLIREVGKRYEGGWRGEKRSEVKKRKRSKERKTEKNAGAEDGYNIYINNRVE